jgi:hypothetical protein
MSGYVQVFGRRNAETIPTLGQPASEKRQGTKSRGVGHRQCSGRYGDLASVGLLGKVERAAFANTNLKFPSSKMCHTGFQ